MLWGKFVCDNGLCEKWCDERWYVTIGWMKNRVVKGILKLGVKVEAEYKIKINYIIKMSRNINKHRFFSISTLK